MKKNIITVLLASAAMFSAASASAQEFRPSGYMGFVDFGDGFDVEDFETYNVTVTTVHGYQFNPHLFLGLGAEMQYITNGSDDYTCLPVFLDFRYNILKSRVTPFIELRGGYDFVETKEQYEAAQIGVDVALTERFGLYAGVNFHTQFGYDFDFRRWEEEDLERISYVGFTLGLHF